MVAIKKAFLMVAGSAVQKFGANLDEHQQLLMAASDMLIEIWLKVLSLEQRNWQRIKEDKVQEQIAMAKLYLSSSRYRYSKGKESYFFCGR
jgi:hypothetical protein